MIIFWFLRVIFAVLFLFSASNLSYYLVSDFNSLTLLEDINIERKNSAYFAVKGDDNEKLKSAYRDIVSNLSSLDIDGELCCQVSINSPDDLYSSTSNLLSGTFKILLKDNKAFYRDNFYNDIQYVFQINKSKYPELEIYWSGLISFEQDFYHELWKYSKKVIVFSLLAIFIFSLVFSRNITKSFDFLLILSFSIFINMFSSKLIFGEISILTLPISAVSALVLFVSLIQYNQRSNKLYGSHLIFISIISLVVLLFHPALVVKKIVFSCIVSLISLYVSLLFYLRGISCVRIRELFEIDASKTISITKSIFFITLLIFVASLYYKYPKLNYDISTFHKPESRILDEENNLRRLIKDESYFAILPYSSLTNIDELRGGLNNFELLFSGLNKKYYTLGFLLALVQICFIVFFAYLLSYRIAKTFFLILLSIFLYLTVLSISYPLMLSFFLPMFASLFIVVISPLIVDLNKTIKINSFSVFCLLTYFVITLFLISTKIPAFTALALALTFLALNLTIYALKFSILKL